MKRALILLAFCAFGATALLAQQHGADMDKMQGGGSLPAGWSVRLDSGATKPDGVSVMPMGGGIHFKSGPAGIYYRSRRHEERQLRSARLVQPGRTGGRIRKRTACLSEARTSQPPRRNTPTSSCARTACS